MIAPDGRTWRMPARGFLPSACSRPAADQRLYAGGLKSKFLFLIQREERRWSRQTSLATGNEAWRRRVEMLRDASWQLHVFKPE